MNSIELSFDFIYEKVRQAIAESLGIDEEEITPVSALVDDLGAESIDLIDISFRLEESFNLQMPQRSLIEIALDVLGEGVIEEDGKLNEFGINLLKARMPEVDVQQFHEGLRIHEFNTLLTVRTFVRLIQDLLDSLPSQCVNCGNTELVIEDRFSLLCQQCGDKMVAPSGDEIAKEWILEFKTGDEPTHNTNA